MKLAVIFLKEHYEWIYQEEFFNNTRDVASVAFEVLITNSEIDFINLFIFSCLTSNINCSIFNCFTSNINLFNFNCLTSNFCFPKNISFANKRKRLFMDSCSYLRILNSSAKMMTCYLQDTNKFLRYSPLHTSMLKWGFPTKGIELTWLIFSEALEMPQLQGTSVWTILVGTVLKFVEYK